VPAVGASTWEAVITAKRKSARRAKKPASSAPATRETEAAAALREREERLSQIADNIQEVYHLFSADGSQTLYVSPAYETIFGRTCQSLYDDPLSFVNALHPDDRPRLLAQLAAIRDGAVGEMQELRVVRPDGQERWILARAVGVKDAKGVVQRVAGVALDITKRKRAEQALALQNLVLSTQLQTSLEGILVVDEDRHILSFNRRFAQIFAIRPDLLAAGDDGPVLQAAVEMSADPEAFLARVRHLYEHREEKSQEEIALKDGRTIERYSAPMLDGEGRYHGRVWYFRDISERRQAEETIRWERFLMNTLMETIPDTIYFKDVESRFLRINRACAERSGLRDPAEAVGKTDFDLFAREHAEAAFQTEREILRTGQPVVNQEEMETWPDRPSAWVSTTKMPLRDAHGSIIGTFGISRDITERKEAEEALRRSEQRFRTVFDRMQLVGLELDSAGRITYCNDFFLELTGCSRDEVLGADYLRTFLPTGSPALEVFAHAVASGELPRHFKNAIVTCDGGLREVEWNNTLLREGDDRIVGTVSIGEDVTERELAAHELRRSEAEFRGLVEHAPVGIYRATPEGRFLTVNPALIRMLGYGWAEEVIRLDVARDVYADPAAHGRLIRESPQRAEVEWKRKDGSVITVEITSHSIPAPDGQVVYEGVVVDVTQHRTLEAQFRQAQRLEAVGRLAGGVAHDFNNVLTAITGYSDLLLEDLAPEDPKRPDVEEIKAAALRAAALTRQLLAFSRKQVFQTKVLSLNEVVETLDKMLHRLIGEDIKLEHVLAPALGAVRADPGQLEQVILNLAVNSRDAMPSGGKLTIETANVDLDEAYAREHTGAAPGPHVMLAVSDTGVGMNEETLAHIFEPFFTTKEQGKGTGLGLATVYGIVKQSGGYVWAYSEPGRGTTFKIYLPRVEAALDSAVPAAAPPPVAGGRETILLAEDDPSVRAVVSDVLAQKGYRVLRAPDGQAALEMARGQEAQIHLLVTDLVWPGMTGRELAESLKAERPDVRVLYMSGYTDDAVVRHGVLEEGMPYLQKPFTPRALSAKVREVLDQR